MDQTRKLGRLGDDLDSAREMSCQKMRKQAAEARKREGQKPLYRKVLDRKGISLSAGAVLLACLATAFLPQTAYAHALLVRSTPPRNGEMAAGTVNAALTFNSRVVATRSSLSLLEPGGKVIGLTIQPTSQPQVLLTKFDAVAKGAYVLRWQALSTDGHITRGEIPFRVR